MHNGKINSINYNFARKQKKKHKKITEWKIISETISLHTYTQAPEQTYKKSNTRSCKHCICLHLLALIPTQPLWHQDKTVLIGYITPTPGKEFHKQPRS